MLEQARIFARGPKAHGAVRAAGLLDAQSSELDTTASLVDAMIAAGLTGGQVAIQLHGFTDDVQLARLREVSARVLTVTPYRWARPLARERLPRLIKAACRHQLDAVTFTSAPAASALLETADSLGLRADLVRAMSRARRRGGGRTGDRRTAAGGRHHPGRAGPLPAGRADPAGVGGAGRAARTPVPQRPDRDRAARTQRPGRRPARHARPERAAAVHRAGVQRLGRLPAASWSTGCPTSWTTTPSRWR